MKVFAVREKEELVLILQSLNRWSGFGLSDLSIALLTGDRRSILGISWGWFVVNWSILLFFKSIFFLNHFLFFFFFLFSAFGISFSIFLPHKNIFVVVLSVFLFPTLILSLTANDRAVFYPQVSSVIFLYIYFPLCCFLPSKLISFAFFAFFFAFILDTG